MREEKEREESHMKLHCEPLLSNLKSSGVLCHAVPHAALDCTRDLVLHIGSALWDHVDLARHFIENLYKGCNISLNNVLFSTVVNLLQISLNCFNLNFFGNP